MEKTNAKVFWATIAIAVAIIAAGSISTTMTSLPAGVHDDEASAVTQQQSIDFGNGTSVHVEVVAD